MDRNIKLQRAAAGIVGLREIGARLEGLEPRRMLAVDPYCGVDTPGWHEHAHEIDPNGVGPTGGGSGGAGEYQLTSRWSSTATNGANTGTSGTPITLTWGFIADGTPIPGGIGEPSSPSNLQTRLNARWGSQATWQALFQQVFDGWSAASGITYVFEPNDDGATHQSAPGVLGVRADLRIGGHSIDGQSGTLAYNFFPNNGDMTLDTDDLTAGGFMFGLANNSRALRNVIAHEHGHGMGLLHVDPINNTKLMEAFASTAFEMMQFDDILGTQRHYGDVKEKPARNDTAASAFNLGNWVNGSNQTLATQVSVRDGADNDLYKLTAATGKTVTLTVTPNGPTYNQGSQGGGTSSFNASQQADLQLSVLASDGVTPLATVNAGGLGVAETISNLSLNAGDVYLRVFAASGATQMYTLTANTVNDSSAPPSPSQPDLAQLDDRGPSDSDNVTNDTTPTFAGTGITGATIRLYAGLTQIGQTIADAVTGAWSITAAPAFSDGTYGITATATTVGGTSAASTPTTLVVDTLAPTANGANFDFPVGHRNQITFSENMTGALIPSRFTVTNLTTSTVVPSNQIATSFNVPTNTATVTYPGATGGPGAGLLGDGNYRFDFTNTTDLAGNALVFTGSSDFFVLHGDFNRNRAVGLDDFASLTANYNQTPRGFNQGDANYDGTVGLVDFAALTTNFQKTLPPPASLPAASPALASSRPANASRATLFADRTIDADEDVLPA